MDELEYKEMFIGSGEYMRKYPYRYRHFVGQLLEKMAKHGIYEKENGRYILKKSILDKLDSFIKSKA